MSGFLQDKEITYITNKYASENTFIGRETQTFDLPEFSEIKGLLPEVMWENHNSAIECYYKAWEIAFSNISNPSAESGFISPYIDAAFNGHIFMWDSCFMLMFGKYASDIFNFQKTLDNFYALQHKDGFISREIREKCGWGCGMDNQPRLKDNSSIEERYFSTGNMIWVDTCMQQLISCNVLIKMADICGRMEDVKSIIEEKENLKKLINEKLWDDGTKFYYDLWEDNNLNMVKTAGAYWALLADVVPADKKDDFVEHLRNENEFNRFNRVPTLSADNEDYSEKGNYWCGSVWAPTNYMILKGLDKNGYHELCYEIAKNCVKNVVTVFEETGTTSGT